MTRNQRRWHARIWSGLPILLVLALALALVRRHHVERELRPAPAANHRSAP